MSNMNEDNAMQQQEHKPVEGEVLTQTDHSHSKTVKFVLLKMLWKIISCGIQCR